MPEDQTLEVAARDVSYEVKYLFLAADLMADVKDEHKRRLIFEALLIHFRNTLEFFYGGKRGPGDIRFSDFAKGWSPTPPDWFDEYRRRCNKLLAHLTYARCEYAKKGEMKWELDDKLTFMRATWIEFQASLPEHRARWFR